VTTVVVSLISFIVVFALLLYGIIWAMNATMKRMVGNKHKALEEIANTGRVPHSWSKPYDRKISHLRREPQSEENVARVQARANEQYLANLDNLTHYVRTSRLIQGEDTRNMLLERLSTLRSELRTQSPHRAGHL
jgi:hypothetical protein